MCGSVWTCVVKEKVDDYFACGPSNPKLSEYLYVCGGRVCGSVWKCVLRGRFGDYFAYVEMCSESKIRR